MGQPDLSNRFTWSKGQEITERMLRFKYGDEFAKIVEKASQQHRLHCDMKACWGNGYYIYQENEIEAFAKAIKEGRGDEWAVKGSPWLKKKQAAAKEEVATDLKLLPGGGVEKKAASPSPKSPN